MKRSDTWKIHYFTHKSNEEKPYKCQHCTMGFVQPARLKAHMLKQHGGEDVKPFTYQQFPVKNEF